MGQKNRWVLIPVACVAVVFVALLIWKVLLRHNRAYDDSYSMEMNTSADTTKEFDENCRKSYQMTDRFLKSVH